VDDYASMLATLEGRMSREDIAAALGVEERELDEIASGFTPDEDVGLRLRALAASGARRSIMRIPVWAIVLFVAVDAVFFAAVAIFLLVR
jgi:hypothetical protein